MKIIIADTQKDVASAMKKEFKDMKDVEVHEGSIFDVECDAIVSPANSFGFMDGGIDLNLSEYLGWQVQETLQKRIREKHNGELLVGLADIVQTGHPKVPFLIAAPTMRVPMALTDTLNVYLATRAVMILTKYGSLDDGTMVKDVIKVLAMSGMGTGIGRVPPRVAARQMKDAINDILYSKQAFPESWREAKNWHERMISGLPARR